MNRCLIELVGGSILDELEDRNLITDLDEATYQEIMEAVGKVACTVVGEELIGD